MFKISNLLSPWEEKLIETLKTHLVKAKKRNQNLFFGAKLTKTSLEDYLKAKIAPDTVQAQLQSAPELAASMQNKHNDETQTWIFFFSEGKDTGHKMWLSFHYSHRTEAKQDILQV